MQRSKRNYYSITSSVRASTDGGNDGQDTRAIQHYLGHKSINSTVRYTALAPDRFKGLLEGLSR
jgi:hypothetical protein